MKRLALRFRRAVLTAVTTFAVLGTSLLCPSNAFAWVRMAPLRRSTLIWEAIAGLVITLVMAGDGAATPEPGEAELCRRLDSQLNINEVDWQPNGDWIVFAREGDGLGNTVYLWKVRADGSGLQQLTFRGVAETPRWSPDGSKIAFVQANRAWLINSDGTGLRALTRTQCVQAVIGWSPDGSRIALAVERGDEPACILICNSTTGEEVSIIGNGVEGDWHPSGDYLVTSWDASWTEPMYSHIVEIAVGTKQKTFLTTGAFDDYSPRYSRDGQWIYFYAYRGGDGTQGYLCRVARTGGEPEVLTHLPDMAGFALSPDGRSIVFVNALTTDLYICRIDGTGLRKITSFYPDDRAKAGASNAPKASGKRAPAKPKPAPDQTRQPARPAGKKEEKRSSGAPLPWIAPPIPIKKHG
ncbi:MAG: PD40 domain-containing protein [Chthonomonadetes bacterium]|nr:PD40 domain-containing protein [Chthonomonadetes bacterium]